MWPARKSRSHFFWIGVGGANQDFVDSVEVPAPPPPESTIQALPGTENYFMSKKLHAVLIITAFAALVSASGLLAQGLPRTQAWAGCELYDSAVTKATFKPGHGEFDELYAGGSGFKDGAGLISDAAPGYGDYNGGRWHLNVLKAGVDPGKYSSACTVDDLDLNDFDSTDQYFECPLMPRKNR